MMEERSTVDKVERDDQFRVRVALEGVIGDGIDVGSNGIVIVYLAIDDGVYGPIWTMKRLFTFGGEVIDS